MCQLPVANGFATKQHVAVPPQSRDDLDQTRPRDLRRAYPNPANTRVLVHGVLHEYLYVSFPTKSECILL